jgi:hypothetical protein
LAEFKFLVIFWSENFAFHCLLSMKQSIWQKILICSSQNHFSWCEKHSTVSSMIQLSTTNSVEFEQERYFGWRLFETVFMNGEQFKDEFWWAVWSNEIFSFWRWRWVNDSGWILLSKVMNYLMDYLDFDLDFDFAGLIRRNFGGFRGLHLQQNFRFNFIKAEYEHFKIWEESFRDGKFSKLNDWMIEWLINWF